MRGFLLLASVLLAPAPAAARSPTTEQIEVMEAVDAFFDALRNEDKTALANHMIEEGKIFIHDRRTNGLKMVSAEAFLARHERGTARVDERMSYDTVLVSGDMAQVWGPYAYTVEGRLSHCGINSISLVRREDRWLVGNTSFTVVAPEDCDEIGAHVNALWEDAE